MSLSANFGADMAAKFIIIQMCIIVLAFVIVIPTSKCLVQGQLESTSLPIAVVPEPSQPESTTTNATAVTEKIQPEAISISVAVVPEPSQSALPSTNTTAVPDTIQLESTPQLVNPEPITPESTSIDAAVIPGALTPEPTNTNATALPVPTPLPLHPTLQHMSPRPGEPGSPENPGAVIPGPSQLWLASIFHHGLIPIERLRLLGELCNERTICQEGTCCLQNFGSPRRCKPLGKRGDPCSPRSLTNVYLEMCPCGPNEGTCEDGVCT
ncbi:uncharacterized protein LOC142764864 isoform X2 [Rhipicephalus microplus]|uniref:uncharacterized protein LOC142764864 isoform X2 n=1 Tax=Rhipicephalus microplus TaxID=6941 RepID=UPI003F6CF35B